MQNTIGNAIRLKRKDMGLTLSSLAKDLNISVSTLSRIETGALRASTHLINQLVTLFRGISTIFF